MSRVVTLHRPAGMAILQSGGAGESPFPDFDADPVDPGAAAPARTGVTAPGSSAERHQALCLDETVRKLLEEEHRRGFEEGNAAAEASLQRSLQERLNEERQKTILRAVVQLETLMTNIKKEFEHLEAQAQHIVVRFALGVAEQIVKREVRLDNTLVLQQVKESLRRVLGVEHIKVRVHPLDEAIVREHRASILSHSDSIRDMVIEADEKIERGGCILESDSGNVDARLGTQLKKIEAVLLSAVEEV